MNQSADDIDNLKKDFFRFATLHSWYKHLPIEGTTFVFFKQPKQQIRYNFDKCLTNEERQEFWHFVDATEANSKYLKELFAKGVVMYQAKFGLFLRGVEKNRVGHQRVTGFHVVDKNNKIENYLQQKYPGIDRSDESKILIANLEQNSYLEEVLKFNIYLP